MKRTQDDVREDKVAEAKWRIATGYYNLPDVLEETAERLADQLSDEP